MGSQRGRARRTVEHKLQPRLAFINSCEMIELGRLTVFVEIVVRPGRPQSGDKR